MLANLLIVLPVFALILTGWIARRSGALGETATREVNRLVVYLALPALLFDIVATAKPSDLWDPGFIVAFGLGCIIVFAGTIAWRLFIGRPLADAAIDGLNASYANTGFVGIPLVLSLIGNKGMGVTMISVIFVVCFVFAIALVLIEIGLQKKARRRDIARKTCVALIKNPLLLSPALGALWMATGWGLPVPVQTFLKILGGAASPCALLTLGLFLAGTSAGQERPRLATTSILVGLKLVGQPVLTWLVAAPLLHLSAFTTHMAVLLAAMPVGTGPFMLAEFYNREAALTGRVVLISTILSVVTISAYLSVAA